MKRIAICWNEKIFNRIPTSEGFIKVLEKRGIPYEKIDCYSTDVIERLNGVDILIWNIQNYLYCDLLESRSIINAAEIMGVKCFPDHSTNWHFDDKIAEMYAFQATGVPIPKSDVFYSSKDCIEWLNTKAVFPLVAKLRNGSGASNVKLLKRKGEAIRYTKKMFGRGYAPAPSLLYKAYSKAQSSKNWAMAIERIKKIPRFLSTRKHAKQMPREHGYCYFQEFIPNDGYDIKIIVVNNKVTFFTRFNRKGDFRASGGGDFCYDRSFVTDEIIHTAFDAADKLKLQCVGFDFVVDNRTGNGMIVEMCYGFDFEAAAAAKGFWDRSGIWHDQEINIFEEIIDLILLEDEETV